MNGIATYFSQLQAKADSQRTLLSAFIAAGVPTSTFYRARDGADMKHSTAVKVDRALDLLVANDGDRHERTGKAA